jgi:hypothetical protein
MAKTYIGYAQREAETNVNWGAVATQFSDMLTEQQKLKEENEAADALVTQELATQLQSAPEGGDQESSDYILDYVNNASNYNLMLKRNLDNGSMNRKQFTKLSQNLSNGTAQIIAIANKYNGYLEEQQKRLEEDKLSGKDGWAAGKVQSFNDFRTTAAFIDPVTMKVSNGKLVSKKVGDKTVRSLSTNTADFQQVSTMLGWMGQKTDKFNVNAAIESSFKMLAPAYQQNKDDGSIRDDIRQNPKFKDASKKQLMSYLSTPDNVGSILYDFARMSPDGTPWEFTDDVNKAKNKNAIYMKPDDAGVYNIDLESKQGKYLQEEAYKVLAAQLDLKIPRKTTKKATPGGFDKDSAAYNNESIQIFDAASNWMNLRNAVGTSNFESAKNTIIAESRNNDKMIDITDISSKGNQLTVTYFDKNTNQNNTMPISMSGDNKDFLNQGSFYIGSTVSEMQNRLGKQNYGKLISGQRLMGEDNKYVDFNSPGISETDIPYNALQIVVGTGDTAKNISLNDYITNIDEYVQGKGADALSFGLNEIFAKQTNPNKSKNLTGLIIDKVEDNVLEVYLPEVMTAPVYLEVDEPSTTNAVVREIYNALNVDGKITPRQLSKMLGKQYSKQEQFIIDRKAANKLDPKVQWNDGMGRQQADSRVKVTDETVISTIVPTEILGYTQGVYPSINAIRNAHKQSEDPAIKALALDYPLMQQYFLEAKKDFDKSN